MLSAIVAGGGCYKILLRGDEMAIRSPSRVDGRGFVQVLVIGYPLSFPECLQTHADLYDLGSLSPAEDCCGEITSAIFEFFITINVGVIVPLSLVDCTYFSGRCTYADCALMSCSMVSQKRMAASFSVSRSPLTQ